MFDFANVRVRRNGFVTGALCLALMGCVVACSMHETARAESKDASAGASEKDIVDTAVAAGQFKTLATALGAAGLVDTLKGAGPFTVFAPTNNAFSMLPAGTVDTLLKPENKNTLAQVLTYHVVPGRVDAASLAQQIKAGGGKAMLKTASGGTLTASMRGNDVIITDVKGNAAVVTTADVYQSNGVIHVVDKVLLPG